MKRLVPISCLRVLSVFLLDFSSWAVAQEPTLMNSSSEGQETPDTLVLGDVTISILPFLDKHEEATGAYHYLDISSLGEMPPIEPSEIYNRIPGVIMVSGAINTNRLIIRGVGSRTPYNTNRIRAYLDEIPLTSGDGISSLEDLDLLGIGSIEVLKGPSSALYGSGLGGVVKLSSPYPDQNGFTIAFKGEYGAFQTGRAGSLLAYKAGPWAVTAGGVHSFSNGYRENSQYARTNLFLSARRFGNRHSLSITLSFVSLDAGIPSSLDEEDYLHRPWMAAENWLSVHGHEKYSKLHAGGKLESRLGPVLTNHLVLFTSLSDPYESRPFNILDDRSSNIGFREYIEARKKRIRIRAGAEGFHERYNWQIYETLQGIRGVMESDQRELRQYANLFLAGQLRTGTRWIIDGGLNMNVLTYRLHTLYRSDSIDNSGEYNYRPVLSPRAGVSFRLHPAHYVYASAGHGFSAPSLEETLLPEGAVNTALKPETGWNMELGARGAFGGRSLRYDLAVYSILLNNLLVTERITEDIFTGANAGTAKLKGLEAWVQYHLRPDTMQVPFNVLVTMGYALSDHRFATFIDDGVDFSGNRLPGIPVRQLTCSALCRFEMLSLGIHYQYTGSQWMDDANGMLYNGFNLFSLQAGYTLAIPGSPFIMELSGGIQNLLDTRYASMILVNAPSFDGSAPRSYYPGLPRHIRICMSLHLN